MHRCWFKGFKGSLIWEEKESIGNLQFYSDLMSMLFVKARTTAKFAQTLFDVRLLCHALHI